MSKLDQRKALPRRGLFAKVKAKKATVLTTRDLGGQRGVMEAELATVGYVFPNVSVKRVRRDKPGTLIALRLHDDLLTRLDAVCGSGTRQEAIRRILDKELPK